MLALFCAFSFILNALAMVNNDLLDLELAKQVVNIIILPVAQGLYETKKHVENACTPIVCLISLNNEIYSQHEACLKESTQTKIRDFNLHLKNLFNALKKDHYSLKVYMTLPQSFEKIKEYISLIESLAQEEPCLQSYGNKYSHNFVNLACVTNQVSIMATFLPKDAVKT